jgi:5-formyltetrahydrofolate cyclo-ligase
MDAVTSKNYLRRQMLQYRYNLPIEIWRESSDRVCQHLQNYPRFTRSRSVSWGESRTILAYQAFRLEVDLSQLFTDPRPSWGLPRCEGKSLIWHVWKPGESLVTGAYGILEPDRALPIVEPEKVDLMLIPAVAMDRRGYRLGYGGGYYDRMLADPVWARAFKIGIAFDFAYVEHLPVEDWDLPLDAIATESGIWEL